MATKRTGSDFSTGAPSLTEKLSDKLNSFLEFLGNPLFWTIFILFFLILKLARIITKTIEYFLKSVVFLYKLILGIFLLPIRILRKLLIDPLIKRVPSRIKVKLPSPPKLKIKKPKLRRPKLGFRHLLLAIFLLLLCTSGTWAYLVILKDLPHPDRLVDRPRIVSTKIYDRKGRLLYKIYRNQNRSLVKLEDVPPHLIQATIAIEDAEFYHHHGFSIRGITRSVIQNLTQGKLQGGSTITQQLVKNTLLTPEKTLIRKIKELVLSLQVEMRFNKEEILQMYLNESGYGGAVYGIEEAAWKYFNKPARKLSLAESALLAGLPASPTHYSPIGAHPELAKERQIQVLQRMVAEGFISPLEAEEAKAEELKFALQKTDIKAPHFVMYVKDLLAQTYGEQLVESGGLKVITSLDLDIQELVQKKVAEEVKNLKNLNVTNGAALVTHPHTGEVLAMVGSADYFNQENDGNVNVTLRPRQPGSAIKPINYAVALGMGYTPATILSDTPITYRLPGQEPYSPHNYDGRFHGRIPLRVALASSYNVPAVKVLSSYGVDRMIEMGKKLGVTTWDDPNRFGLSLTLGGGEIKMTDLAVVYGTLANLGKKIELHPILKVIDYQGNVYEEYHCPQEKGTLPKGLTIRTEKEEACPFETVLDPKVAYLITDILTDNKARIPAFGAHSLLNIPGKKIAVKTGTTNNLRDNWTIGYTPNLLVATWVGNNDNSPMSQVASGLTGASSIWNKIIINLLEKYPNQTFQQPAGIVEVKICPYTGTLPCRGCPVKTELFINGTQPKTHCRYIKKQEEKEREKILGAQSQTRRANPATHIVDYQSLQNNQVIWERIIR